MSPFFIDKIKKFNKSIWFYISYSKILKELKFVISDKNYLIIGWKQSTKV
jgi:hypothetical protein